MLPWFACVLLLELGLASSRVYDDGIGCRDNNGQLVDWFTVYKLPTLSESSEPLVRNGVGQAYMDVNKQSWTLLNKGIDDTDHAVYNTLNQIYKNANSENFAYVLYNDETPEGKVYYSQGHTKGDIGFGQTSGFWLIHSVPKFPPSASESYSYPDSGKVFGQTFLCVTFNYNSFNTIGGQLLYYYPKIYNYNLPTSFSKDNPLLASAVQGSHVTSDPFYKVQNLTSSGGRTFTSFAKCSKFGKDLYHDLVAPYLRSGLLTETWQNGGEKLDSDCSQYKVLNVQSLSILQQDFKETHDHSKWAVTDNGNLIQSQSLKWICIGDINRMESQTKRAGGTLCSNIDGVWSNFRSVINDTEPCP